MKSPVWAVAYGRNRTRHIAVGLIPRRHNKSTHSLLSLCFRFVVRHLDDVNEGNRLVPIWGTSDCALIRINGKRLRIVFWIARKKRQSALFTYRVGAETTTGMIGLIVRTLIQQPWLQQKIRESPSLGPAIVSEVLRLESNVQRLLRVTREARIIGGRTIQPGERLLLLLGAANRDPDAFVEPDILCLNRREAPDLVFGAGNHFCLGASLARLEGEVALTQILRLPPIVQAGDEEWYSGRTIRRLIRLPVRVQDFTPFRLVR
jgi:Cytochrome P450